MLLNKLIYSTLITIGFTGINLSAAAENPTDNSVGSERIFINQEGLKKLESAASGRGWHVERDTEGNLRLYPSGKALDKPSEETTGGVIGVGELGKLESALGTHGWKSERDSEGNLLLYPPGQIQVEATPISKNANDPEGAKISEDTSPVSDKDETVKVDARDLQQLQTLAKQHGWKTKTDDQGNLLLFVRDSDTTAVTETITVIESASITNCQFGSISIKQQKSPILPVDQWGKAKMIAELVIEATGVETESVGKIREINNLYIVSIVSRESPYSLLRQLVIHKSDGRAISFP